MVSTVERGRGTIEICGGYPNTALFFALSYQFTLSFPASLLLCCTCEAALPHAPRAPQAVIGAHTASSHATTPRKMTTGVRLINIYYSEGFSLYLCMAFSSAVARVVEVMWLMIYIYPDVIIFVCDSLPS
jgi:hypothetical protein